MINLRILKDLVLDSRKIILFCIDFNQNSLKYFRSFFMGERSDW